MVSRETAVGLRSQPLCGDEDIQFISSSLQLLQINLTWLDMTQVVVCQRSHGGWSTKPKQHFVTPLLLDNKMFVFIK